MFKTILKTLALSATTLTLLSACGTLADLNAAIRAYEAQERESNRGSALTVAVPTAEERRQARKIRFGGDEYRLSEEEYRAALVPLHGDGSGFYSRTNELADLYRLGGEGYRVAAVAHLAEASRVMEENDDSYTELYRLEELRSKEYRLEHERRIQDEFKEDPSAFNTTSARVASIRMVGTYYDNGTPYHGDDIEDITHSQTQDTFGIRKDEGVEPALILTLNGVEYDMIPEIIAHEEAEHLGATIAYKSHYHNEENNIYFVGSPNILKILGGTHATIQGDYVEYATYVDGVIGIDNNYESESQRSVDHRTGFATIGIPTPASVVDAQTAVAIYKGTAGDLSFLDRIPFWTSSTTEITMNVDFDANTIAGTGSGSDGPRTNKIIFNSAPIVGNGFEGTFAINSDMRDSYGLIDNPTGQYSGNFFGPNADDLAGVMSLDATARQYDEGYGETNDPFAVIGIGAFRADRQ